MTSTLNAKPTPQPSGEMLGMLNAFLTVQALHVAAFLGVADLLAAGSKTVDEFCTLCISKCGEWTRTGHPQTRSEGISQLHQANESRP